MRFIVTDEQDISLNALESGLRQKDSAYSIERDNADDDEGELKYNNDLYGAIEINRPGDGLFDDEIGELKEFLEEVEGERKEEVFRVLNEASAIVALQVLQQGRATDGETLVKIDPLWDWLFANRKGLLQAEAEGYYDASGLVISVD